MLENKPKLQTSVHILENQSKFWIPVQIPKANPHPIGIEHCIIVRCLGHCNYGTELCFRNLALLSFSIAVAIPLHDIFYHLDRITAEITGSLGKIINQHNFGNGSILNQPPHIQLFSVIVYICGSGVCVVFSRKMNTNGKWGYIYLHEIV